MKTCLAPNKLILPLCLLLVADFGFVAATGNNNNNEIAPDYSDINDYRENYWLDPYTFPGPYIYNHYSRFPARINAINNPRQYPGVPIARRSSEDSDRKVVARRGKSRSKNLMMRIFK